MLKGRTIRPTGLKALSVLVMAVAASQAQAGMVQDHHGNVGYDTAAECDAAVQAGTAKFYKSFTYKPPLIRKGEVSVESLPLSQADPKYARGACDIGAGHSGGRDGVAPELQGKFVPYGPDMLVNVYADRNGNPVRMTMKQCDNWFGAMTPRPVPELPKVVKPVAAAPAPVIQTPVAPPPVVQAPAPVVAAPALPVAPPPVPAQAAIAAATPVGYVGVGVLAAGAVAAAVLLHHDSGSTAGTTGTTGTR